MEVRKMKKLKDLLKESFVWERQFGEKLPTLDSIQKKHDEGKLTEKEDKGESTWTVVYKGLLAGFKKAKDKRLEVVAQAVGFLIKTEFGAGAKNDFIKAFKKSL